MKQEFDNFLKAAGSAVDQAAKTAEGFISKGKGKAEVYSLEKKLNKMQQQLGALVYTLHKNDREDETMMQWYFNEIDEINAQIAKVENPEFNDLGPNFCPSCGTESTENATYCSNCGTKLS